jgi:hypothetical protein
MKKLKSETLKAEIEKRNGEGEGGPREREFSLYRVAGRRKGQSY